MAIINPNLRHLCNAYYNPKKGGAVLEGSSRSGKTWSTLDFIIRYCSENEGKTINILRETYQSFKTTLYLDCNKRFPMFGLVSPFQDVQERSTFKLFGNQVNLIGADKPSKFMGAGCDILWINEAIHVDQRIFDQAEMRCNEFFILDYNPEVTEHWIYDSVTTREDVAFLKTTFLDNPFTPPKQRKKILSYQPLPEKYANLKNVSKELALEAVKELDEEKKSEIIRCWQNHKEGTCSAYMWDVFGLGKRARKEGAIYTRWKEGQFNEDLQSFEGIDFGWTDPFAMIELAIDEPKKIIYLREKIYQSELIKWKDRVTQLSPKNRVKVCDSALPGSIVELQDEGHNAISAWKGKGSIIQGIQWIQGYMLIVDPESVNLKTELSQYEWADKKSNTPIDKYNHLLDAMRYAYAYYKQYVLQE